MKCLSGTFPKYDFVCIASSGGGGGGGREKEGGREVYWRGGEKLMEENILRGKN